MFFFDKINYKILISLPEFLKRTLLNIFNDLYNTDLFPKQWQEYVIVFIPKNNSDKVRPIAMAFCILKLFEKMLNVRLTYWLESNKLFSLHQHAFRKGKSCADKLSIITSEIHKSFDKKESVIALFLDVSCTQCHTQ